MTRATALKQRALEVGFDLVGIAPLSAWEDLGFCRQWMEQGYGGEMRYLENPKRDDPRRILPSVQSVVCVGLVYNAPFPYSTEVSRHWSVVSGHLPATRGATTRAPVPESKIPTSPAAREAADNGPRTKEQGHDSAAHAWISRYAWGRDYHQVMRGKLERLRTVIEGFEPGVETRVYVDTGPIVERAFARYSGIGWTGKNTCLINESKGSWFFIGVILTSLELEPDLPAPDRCGSCTRCIEACPTGALVEPYVMDASRCIAYFTIELKGSIPAEFRPAIGANVFGCDICQDVCPWNSRPPSASNLQQASSQPHGTAARTNVPEFEPARVNLAPGDATGFSLFNPRLEDLAALTQEDFDRVFARSPIKRTKYRGWLRNLCVLMGNSGDPRFVPWLERVRGHPDAVVREHAEWALGQITHERPMASA